MQTLYPLVFIPQFKELVWGGARLATELGKSCSPERRIGESWELVDLPSDRSVVAEGPLAGKTLHEVMEGHRDALMGPVADADGRFPLLVKYIDAARTLSVQVHPGEEAARALGGRPKHEAWYILAAEPGAKLYLGMKPGTTREVLEEAIADDRVEELLAAVDARPGDLVPVEPGTVHAIGAGVLLAEVQQPSDTTYRLHDWGRVGLDGKPRQMHVREALASIDFSAQVTRGAKEHDAGHFMIRVRSTADGPLPVEDHAGPLVVVGLDGTGRAIDDAGRAVELHRGQVALFPHCARPVRIEGDELEVMLVTFPSPV